MMSKAELARMAKVSSITITRIENGMPCQMKTMRKILGGLGKKLSDKETIFPNDQRSRWKAIVDGIQHDR